MWPRILAVSLIAVATIAGGHARAQALNPETINSADLKETAKSGKKASKTKLDPVMVKAQVLLDRARFSPGVIDGHNGDNLKKAIAAFQRAKGLNESGSLDRETWSKLTDGVSEPIVKEYAITDADLKGPFVAKVPAKMEDQAKLDHLAYTSPRQELAERFHMDEGLLKTLNPGKAFDKAGETITVANVADARPKESKGDVTRIEVDKKARALRAYGKDGQLLAVYPASIGSEEKPAPSGELEVRAVAQNPTYTYDPKYKFKGVKADKPFTIKPGPNNPVGAVWIALSDKGYGIHGTPHPAQVGKTYSHGCVRLTNWDAKDLAGMVEKGTKVAFLDQ